MALSTHDDTLVSAPGLVDETLTLTRVRTADPPRESASPAARLHTDAPGASGAQAVGIEPGEGAA